jgi:hypothetical protein
MLMYWNGAKLRRGTAVYGFIVHGVAAELGIEGAVKVRQYEVEPFAREYSTRQ